MKEAYRLQKSELKTILLQKNLQLAVFVIYTGKELPDLKLVTDKIALILQQLVKIANESPSSVS